MASRTGSCKTEAALPFYAADLKAALGKLPMLAMWRSPTISPGKRRVVGIIVPAWHERQRQTWHWESSCRHAQGLLTDMARVGINA
mmetsp:Transcript_36403/g.116808  ORF Transcript_36403/g.116808 Transcript_36403/m.116808 type:complete len:86 (-) Transcript_36403:79-336(-)